MSYPLRLPPELDAQARQQAQRLGISLNALIAVALDAYFRGLPAAPAAKPPGKPSAAPAGRSKQPKRHKVKPVQQQAEHPDAERARRLGIPPGMEDFYDLDLYEECLGPDAKPVSDEEYGALVDEFEATMQRRQQAINKRDRKKGKAPSPGGSADGGSVH